MVGIDETKINKCICKVCVRLPRERTSLSSVRRERGVCWRLRREAVNDGVTEDKAGDSSKDSVMKSGVRREVQGIEFYIPDVPW